MAVEDQADVTVYDEPDGPISSPNVVEDPPNPREEKSVPDTPEPDPRISTTSAGEDESSTAVTGKEMATCGCKANRNPAGGTESTNEPPPTGATPRANSATEDEADVEEPPATPNTTATKGTEKSPGVALAGFDFTSPVSLVILGVVAYFWYDVVFQ